jgi:hypothetical protein
MSRDSEGQGSEVEITPQMIEAGRAAFFDSMGKIDGYDSVPTKDQSAFVVKSVYCAMLFANSTITNKSD